MSPQSPFAQPVSNSTHPAPGSPITSNPLQAPSPRRSISENPYTPASFTPESSDKIAADLAARDDTQGELPQLAATPITVESEASSTPADDPMDTLGEVTQADVKGETVALDSPSSAVNGDHPATPITGGPSGISLVFKRPTPASESRDKPSPGASGRKRRRAIEVAPNPSRASRSRNSSPPRLDSHSNTNSPAPRSSANTPVPSALASSSSAPDPSIPPSLHIFAPPSNSPLPKALQDVIGSSRTVRTAGPSRTAADKDGDVLMREAAEGFDQRRSARSRASAANQGEGEAVRAGVSASGKGVKVGGAVKDAEQKVVKKKGKKNVDVPNQDFCSACRGVGKFLCCDGCPRSFHFMCLEPPLRVDELPEEETWFCKKCRAERGLNPAPPPSPKDREPRPILMTFKQMVKRIEEDNPATFRLPPDIRQFFVGVATDARGNYVDQDETRTKYDRKGFQEERDGTRLRDGKARPVACYVCGGSSIPLRSLTTDPESTWRQIVSCDYCALHWHLDCLSPPLASMPNAGRKWMCPNHAEQVMARRRTVRNHLETVDVDSEGMPNNGNITVLSDDEERPPIEYEDLIINRKRYRVPERVIRLDFWEKLGLGRGRKVPPAKGGDGVFSRHRAQSLDHASSAESDGMSLDDPPSPSQDDLDAAALVLSLTRPNAPVAVKTSATGHLRDPEGKSGTNVDGDRAGTADRASAPGTPSSTMSKESATPKITLRLTRPAV